MKFITPIVLIIVAGCSNRNGQMTSLVNEKKVAEDSIDLARNFEHYYYAQAEKTINDTLKRNLFVDSSGYFFGRGLALKEKLKAAEFSIDSLSRMK